MIKKIIFFTFFFLSIQLINAQLESAKYSIKNLKVNTPYTDMSTSLWGKGRVIYTSSKNSKSVVKSSVKSKDKKKAFLETFTGFIADDYEIVYTKKVDMNFDSQFNQSNVAFTSDLKYVYFTQNEAKKKRGIINLKLFRASVDKKGNWSNIMELPFNSTSYNCAHPTLNEAGTKLYFASDMPGGYGSSDIYVVDIGSNNNFGEPKNLGAYINSSSKDNFPEINNGLLYFSSNRPGGLGGLDIYMVPAQDLFLDPTNLGRPMNSKYDDFSFVINGNMRRGYFTSNRPQGKGGDDIYSFTQETAIKSCSQLVEGVVRDTDTDVIIKNTTINILDNEGKWLNRFATGSDGKFKIKLNKCEKDYKLEAYKKNYTKDLYDVIYQPDKQLHQVTLHITKEEIADNPDKKDLKEPTIPEEEIYLDVKNIDFILNRYDILKHSAEELNKVAKIMKENPTIVVEFGAHTDSRGPDDYNLELSKQRASEVIRYLVSKGVSHNRLYGKGYGETLPVNHCVNDVECTDLEHLANRRTEFVILAR